MRTVFTLTLDTEDDNTSLVQLYDITKATITQALGPSVVTRLGLVCSAPSGIDAELEVHITGKWLL